MPTFTSYEHGCPCWVDLMSPDVDASTAFYSGVFGWQAEEQHDDDGNRIYVMFTLDGRNVAGLGGQPPGMDDMPAFWNTYVSVDDLDATVAKVATSGGSVMAPPMQVMDAGRMAIVTDPTGASISLWQPGAHIGADVCNEPNTMSWNELMTRDVDAALAFYRSVLGWEVVGQDMGPMGTYHVIQGGEHGGWGGIMAMPPGVPEAMPNAWVVYFWVDDTEATAAAVTANGGNVAQDPMDIPGVGRTTVFTDPQGGSFCTLQPAAG